MKRVLGESWTLPALDERNRSWFTSGTLSFQSCLVCSAVQHPPEDVCGSCQGTRFGDRPSAGEGRIESVAVVHHPLHPSLAEVVPYAVVVVSVDDVAGVHVIGNVVGRDAASVAIGDRVHVVFEEIEDPEQGTLRLPQWQVLP